MLHTVLTLSKREIAAFNAPSGLPNGYDHLFFKNYFKQNSRLTKIVIGIFYFFI